MKYIVKKNLLLYPLLNALLLINTGTINPFQLPAKVTQCTSYIKQRAIFTKVFIRALWKFTTNKAPHTLIEQKLAQTYEQALNGSIDHDVADLRAALQNNPAIMIHPQEFVLGASSSAYQIEGGLDETSAAARFYRNKAQLPNAGDAIDFYNRYKDDIKQMKDELHINAFRLSFAWDRIQPTQGVFNTQAILFYKNVIREFLAHGIKPLVVFHHYDVPTWFEDLGGFEKEENGKLFQEFCLHVYTELAEELGQCFVSMCCAPEGPAFKGYFTGEGTPGEKDNLHKTHTVIANMYYELVDTALSIKEKYAELKLSNPELLEPCIGTQINIVPIDPHHTSQLRLLDRLKTTIGCEIASYVQSGGTYNFLVNGEYRIFTPNADFMKQAKGVDVYRYHPDAHKAFDWIGVNIYSNNFINGFQRINGADLIEEDEERYTDNANYRNYPEGIYRAVQMISDNVAVPLGKLKNKDSKPLPILVTENGIATKDDAKRTRYYQRALCTITQLIKDGYGVIGYLPWTSHDNYEWPTQANPEGFNSKCYGFFAVNFDKNSPDYMKRTLKEGSRYYANFAQELFKTA